MPTNLITYLTNVEGFVYVLRAPQKDLCLRWEDPICEHLTAHVSTFESKLNKLIENKCLLLQVQSLQAQ